MLRRRKFIIPALFALVFLSAGACSDDARTDNPLALAAPNLDLVPDGDEDADEILNQNDNCPTTPNPDQVDGDGDGIGDMCDLYPTDPTNGDDDRDGHPYEQDNCPVTPNADQHNSDGDQFGDVCDPFPNDPTNQDFDGDKFRDDVDNCPQIPNKQEDADRDGVGDVCDKYPNDPTNMDTDNDSFSDSFDNCPTVAQKDQFDSDRDGAGDPCDNDRDGDSWDNTTDNCPDMVNVEQTDLDNNGVGDKCQGIKPVMGPVGDFDADGIKDGDDNCPRISNKNQANMDGDRLGDVCDPYVLDPANDVDGDRIGADKDNCDNVPNADQKDSDGDRIGDVCDPTPFKNVAPSVTAVELPVAPIAVGTPVDINIKFTDADAADTHTASINWEATTTSVDVADGARDFSGTHTFMQAGVYTVVVTVTDRLGLSGNRSSTLELPAYIVVYDPSAGFVTGGGWINSPAGACLLSSCTSATMGKATFGFVSKYQKGANVPTGNTEFHFHAGDLRFKSTAYEWLVVAGNKAKYKGEGTINGGGRYGFMITAIDNKDGQDQFRIKIWDLASGSIAYDNRMGSPDDSDAAMDIAAGSIVVHNK